MRDSKRYLYNAMECLSAAQVAHDPYYRELNLSLAVTWISLARQEVATAALVAGWNAGDLDKADRTVSLLRHRPQHRRALAKRDHRFLSVVSEQGQDARG
jgi:hypothetical protein